ncbi:putative uncharacterized protein [Parachlamydia acanthamoebae UV-7]|uniref:UspA domain-containing protein n=2 Tax=Parachlamydia acanthamoebae TaxID=83552 RepID=F8KYC5_PARAV|nr:amino acid permease [Parachlamydia acanthamoebae]KIA78412.1 hypothetical protein DB43_EA00090 [Parachlamydia acanthamoebae]CCB85860.1 putative uncharacterized protein [Parachlamydia acanthamoebae UV-7]
MFTSLTMRPRNVNAYRSAAILYGDWGTSKAYVLGLAFALASYGSFWLILSVSCLNILVGINYMTICRYYPNGGGVYASVRSQSEILALVGAFFLIADYLVTAALSALSAFNYLGVSNPEHWAVGSIVAIGALNFLGPKYTGSLAALISLPTVLVVIALGLLSLPFLPTAIQHVQPLSPHFSVNWDHFVGIIVALSGIEAIANTTGVMPLNAGCDEKHQCVSNTSTPAIFWVMLEVSFFTALFGLAMMALPGLHVSGNEVYNATGSEIRDSMLRYMGTYFSSAYFGPEIGQLFGAAIGIVFFVLLLSAVNTAIVALVSLFFVMSRDGELPFAFQKLNLFGVPNLPLFLSITIPAFLVFYFKDVAELANLYAVGFVGAIATNLGFSSLNWNLDMQRRERIFMFITFLIMAAIECTLLIDKPNARNFVITIVAVGLLLRGWVVESQQKKWKERKAPLDKAILEEAPIAPSPEGSVLCAVTHIGKSLQFAIHECNQNKQTLCLLFIREQQVITEEDRHRYWLEDEDACEIFDYAKEHLESGKVHFIYVVSDSPAATILETTKKYQSTRLVLGMPRSNKFFQFIRGNIIQEVGKNLSDEIELLVIC